MPMENGPDGLRMPLGLTHYPSLAHNNIATPAGLRLDGLPSYAGSAGSLSQTTNNPMGKIIRPTVRRAGSKTDREENYDKSDDLKIPPSLIHQINGFMY